MAGALPALAQHRVAVEHAEERGGVVLEAEDALELAADHVEAVGAGHRDLDRGVLARLAQRHGGGAGVVVEHEGQAHRPALVRALVVGGREVLQEAPAADSEKGPRGSSTRSGMASA